MLCLDAFRGHLTDEIKNKIHRLKSELVIIPAGMTSVLQPLDVSVSKPFKARLSEQYDCWISDHDRELTALGKIKCAAPHAVAHWVSSAWTSITAELVTKSVKKCCISIVLDGTEGNLLWDNNADDSDVNDPSSNCLYRTLHSWAECFLKFRGPKLGCALDSMAR